MRHFLTLALCCALAQAGVAQQKRQFINSAYTRSSISVLVVNRPASGGSTQGDRLRTHFAALDLGNKYDINPVSTKIVDVRDVPDFPRLNQQQRAGAIGQKINALDIGRDIIKFWFNRRPSGEMDLSRVWERGMYAATDRDYLQTAGTKRGMDDLKDAGLSLIERSYVVVLDYHNVTLKHSPSSGACYFTGNVDVYLYRLQYDPATQNAIFDTWLDDGASAEEVQQKVNEFNRLTFSVSQVLSTTLSVSSLETGQAMWSTFSTFVEVAAGGSGGSRSTISGCGSADGELRKFAYDGFNQAMQRLEGLQPELKVRTPIISTSPIEAKIGKKEDVRRNQLFQVSEYYLDRRGLLGSRRVAYVRTTSVADNRRVADGDMLTSKFTPISSKKIIRSGMDLTQKNDKRMEAYADLVFGDNFTNFSAGVEYINFYLRGGFSGRTMLDLNICSFDSHGFLGMRLGYNLGYNLISNLSVHGFAAVGAGSSSAVAITENFINDFSFNYGATANLSYLYPLILYVKLDFMSATGGAHMGTGGGIKIAF